MSLLSIEKSLVFVIASTLLALGLNAANQVVVHSQVSEDHLTKRAYDEEKESYTYQFMKGRFHGGNRADSSMEETTFQEIILDMAFHLQKQNFYPIPEKGKSDLLIVVHYGVTTIQESIDDMLGYTSLEDKTGTALGIAQNAGADGKVTSTEMNSISDVAFVANSDIAVSEANEMSARYQAKLIGMEKAFSELISPREEYELKYLLKDERYFVVLMAYDFQKLQKGDPELLWSTRYSIRAKGQSFEDAIKDMNLVAADYFGKHLDDITKKRVTDKERVKLGELELIGREPEE